MMAPALLKKIINETESTYSYTREKTGEHVEVAFLKSHTCHPAHLEITLSQQGIVTRTLKLSAEQVRFLSSFDIDEFQLIKDLLIRPEVMADLQEN